MKILTFSNFNSDGSAQVPGADGFRAFGIAPGSEVDTCLVGGNMLGPCSLVPAAQKLEAVRAPRTPSATYPRASQVGDMLALACYEACDHLVAPSPRAAVHVSTTRATGIWGDSAATATRLLRLPFAGRRTAMFAVARNKFNGDPAENLNLVVRGVRYLSRELVTFNSAFPAIVEESLDRLWDGGAVARPLSTVEPTVTGLQRVLYVDGEAFDELELWVWGPVETGSALYCVGEAYGERVA